MKEIVITRSVAASRGRVWGVITDLDGAVDRLSGIKSIERLGGPEFGVGTRWRETREMFGREATEEMEVTAVDEGRSYRVEADGHGAHYVSVLSVLEAGEGASTLKMSFGAEPGSLGGRIMAATIGRLFAGATRKALKKDLDEIAAAAEAPT